jgi:hypothetical protein
LLRESPVGLTSRSDRGFDRDPEALRFVSVVFSDGSGVVSSLGVLQSEVAETVELFKPDFGQDEKSSKLV